MLFHLALDPIFGAEEVGQHRDALILFSQRVDMLPIAVAVAASLLRERAANCLDRGVSQLQPGRLTDGVTDVPALFHEAIISLPQREQCLLAACSVCAQEGLSLSFACEIAQLSENDANDAADRLVHASLLRVLSREQRRFQLHSLLREATRASMGADALAKLKQAHVAAIEQLFQHWEQRWQDCRECLEEVISAADFLVASNERDRQWRVSNSGFRLARRIGELDIALRILQQDESFLTENTDEETLYRLQASYGNKAAILHAWDRDREAMDLLKKQESICIDLLSREAVQEDRYHETIIKHSVAISYSSQAMILSRWGRLEDALALHQKSAAISQDLNDLEGVAHSYGHQSEILKVWGRTEEAMALLKLEENVCEMLGDKRGLIGCFGRQGTILFFSGRSEEALNLHRKAEVLAIELGYKTGLSASLGNQGVVLRRMGRLDDALVLHKREEVLCLELLDRSGLQVCYGNQALILDDQGFKDEALNLHKKEEAICRELGIKDSLQRSLGNQAVILEDLGHSDEAMTFRKEQEKICMELGNLDDLRVCLTGQARVLMNQDQWNEAMILIDRSIQICDEIGKAQGIAKNLELKALILQHWDRQEEALVLLKMQEEIYHGYKDDQALAHNYGNQAVSLMAIGALDEALLLLKQQKSFCESLSLKKPLAYCHWNLGRLAGGVGDRNGARENLSSAHKLFSELGMAKERDVVQAELRKIAPGLS
jgi:tetratricopeptide (TPR) repeat protein